MRISDWSSDVCSCGLQDRRVTDAILSSGARLKVGFVLVPRFTLTAFAGFIDAIRLAGDEADLSRPIACYWEVVGADDQPIPSSCGVEVRPDEGFGDPSRFDYIGVVGGLLHGGQRISASTIAFLQKAAIRGVPLIGLCTGPFRR